MLNCYFGKKVEPTATQNVLGKTHLFQEQTLPAVHLNQQINSHSQPRSHVSVVVSIAISIIKLCQKFC